MADDALAKIAKSAQDHEQDVLEKWFANAMEEAVFNTFCGIEEPPDPEHVIDHVELLPCPFCGGAGEYHQENHGRGSMGAEPDMGFIRCGECGAKADQFYMHYDTDNISSNNRLYQKAAEAWNRRGTTETACPPK